MVVGEGLDIVDDGLSQDLIDLYNLLDLGPGDLVDTLNRSDLRDLLDRLGRGDLLDRLGLLDARDIYTFEDIFGFWGITDLRDDLRDGLRNVLDQCDAASDSGADSVTTTTQPPASAPEPDGDDVDGG